MSSQLSPVVERNSRRSRLVNNGVIRYFSTFRNTVDDVLAARGWQEVEEGDEFDIVWADREWVTITFDYISNFLLRRNVLTDLFVHPTACPPP